MKYEITTIAQLKADIFDGIYRDAVMPRSSLASLETFNTAVSDYVQMCCDAGPAVIKPSLCPAARTVRAWFDELTAIYN